MTESEQEARELMDRFELLAQQQDSEEYKLRQVLEKWERNETMIWLMIQSPYLPVTAPSFRGQIELKWPVATFRSKDGNFVTLLALPSYREIGVDLSLSPSIILSGHAASASHTEFASDVYLREESPTSDEAMKRTTHIAN